MDDTYSPEEFVKRMKLRGLATISDAKRYIESVGKDFYTEADFIDAYHAIDGGTIGRRIIRQQRDGMAMYFEKGRYGLRFCGVEE